MSQTTVNKKKDVFMDVFDQKLNETTRFYPLKAEKITRLVINVGHKCNLQCTHCYVDASPEKTNMMSLDTMNKILDVLRKNSQITSIEITGGAPELNPYYKYLIKSAADLGKKVTVCSNAVIFFEPGMEDIPEFLAENKIKIYISLPSFDEKHVDGQRGKGAYKKIISALKWLSELGYGKEGTSLELDLLVNPARTPIAPEERILEEIYRDKLKKIHGLTFNNSLVVLNNMPIGRMRKSMSDDEFRRYMKELEGRFNPDTVETLMCRYLIWVSYDEKLYDCDFWKILNLPPVKAKSSYIEDFDYEELKNREIVTNYLCFVCTAGQGCAQGFVKRELL